MPHLLVVFIQAIPNFQWQWIGGVLISNVGAYSGSFFFEY